MSEPLSFKQSELTLFRGTRSCGKGRLILVAEDQMAVTIDFGENDPWRLKINLELPYNYVPLNLSGFKNLTKIW